MRFQVSNPDITSLSVGDASHEVVNGVVEVPTTDEARAALQPLIDRGTLVGLPDEAPADDKPNKKAKA